MAQIAITNEYVMAGLAARNLHNMIGASMSVCGLNSHTFRVDIKSICPSVHPDTA